MYRSERRLESSEDSMSLACYCFFDTKMEAKDVIDRTASAEAVSDLRGRQPSRHELTNGAVGGNPLPAIGGSEYISLGGVPQILPEAKRHTYEASENLQVPRRCKHFWNICLQHDVFLDQSQAQHLLSNGTFYEVKTSGSTRVMILYKRDNPSS